MGFHILTGYAVTLGGTLPTRYRLDRDKRVVHIRKGLDSAALIECLNTAYEDVGGAIRAREKWSGILEWFHQPPEN